MAKKYEMHSFYCVQCGNKGIPISRVHNLREKMHLKELWCVHCKEIVNHAECRDDADVRRFKIRFKEGYYIGKEHKKEV